MKKISVIFCIVFLVTLMLPLTAGAEFPMYHDNPDFQLTGKAPTIDGKIDANEGWSNKGTFDEIHTGRFLAQLPLTSVGEFYFAYDNDGIYFAYTMKEYGGAYTLRLYAPRWNEDAGRDLDECVGSINYPDANVSSYNENNYPEMTPDGNAIEGALLPPDFNTIALKDPSAEHIRCAYWTSNDGNTNEYCTCEDGSDYAFDGDVFALSFDPLGNFHDVCSVAGNNDKAPQFNVGIFEGNVVKVRTSRYSDRELTNVKGAGSINGDTITFEVMIPWDDIVEECNAAAQKIGINHTYIKEEMVAPGTVHRAAITHMDRYNDPDAGYVDDWGRCITVIGMTDLPATEDFPDGIMGIVSSGDIIAAMGLKIVIPGGAAPTDDTTKAADGGDESEAVTDKDGKVVTDENGKVVTQKKNSGSTTKAAGTNAKGSGGGSSAQTFDAGIAFALGSLAVSTIGLYYSKKKH